MKTILKNAIVFTEKQFIRTDIEINDNSISKNSENIDFNNVDEVYNLNNMYLLPG